MKARFLFKMPTVHDYKAKLKRSRIDEVEYVVDRSVHMKYEDFIRLSNHLLEDNNYIIHNRNDMHVDTQGIWHVMLFFAFRADRILLVNASGFNYCRYVALLENKGERVEFHSDHSYRLKKTKGNE